MIESIFSEDEVVNEQAKESDTHPDGAVECILKLQPNTGFNMEKIAVIIFAKFTFKKTVILDLLFILWLMLLDSIRMIHLRLSSLKLKVQMMSKSMKQYIRLQKCKFCYVSSFQYFNTFLLCHERINIFIDQRNYLSKRGRTQMKKGIYTICMIRLEKY